MSATFFTLDELGLRTGDGLQTLSLRADSDESLSDSYVLEINDLATLHELQPVWNELLDKTPRPAFCQTLEWLQLYCQHFGDRQRLRVFCLDQQGDTSGMIALVEQTTRGQLELTLPNIGNETLWPLSRQPSEQWRVLAEHLRSELTRKQTLDLRGLPDPDGGIQAAFRDADLNVQSQPWSSTTSLNLEQGFETFWSRVAPQLRSLVELGEQRLTTHGPTNFVRFRPQATDRTNPRFPDELYQDCLNVALNDEQQLSRSDSVLNAPERHLFLRDLLPWAWRHDAADLCLLLCGSRPIAFRFHTRSNGYLRTIWTGVDAEFRHLPLATLLLYRTLCDSFHRGDVELDLGPTRADVARDWNGRVTPLKRFVVGSLTTPASVPQPEETSLHDD